MLNFIFTYWIHALFGFIGCTVLAALIQYSYGVPCSMR